MPIATSDLTFKLSNPAATSGNATAQANANASLGGWIAPTVVLTGVLNNLFDDISGDENAASTVDYRCFFIQNGNATLTLQNPKIWMSGEVASGADCSIGLDPSGVFDVYRGLTPQATQVALETTAPLGVSFSFPRVKASGLAPANITPSGCIAVWVKRAAQNTAAVNLDGVTIQVAGDSAA